MQPDKTVSSSPKESQDNMLREVTEGDYKYGFVTDIRTDTIAKGLSEKTIRIISEKKEEPEWLLEFRLKAYHKWLTMEQPKWAHLFFSSDQLR